MPPKMVWLANVVRLAIVPVFLGALFLLLEPQRSVRDLAAVACLVLLGAIHVLYWRRPWPALPHWSIAAASGMVVTNVVLLHLLGLTQPLLWLYPALIAGAGFRAPAAAVGVSLTALAAVVPFGPLGSPHSSAGSLVDEILGADHSITLSIVFAGLGMTAVRQLITINADLHTTRAELAELAVVSERERLSRELHDLLGRTMSLIAVKAELAGRLSASGDPLAEAEMRDVQQLARHAVRDVRETIVGDRARSVAAELAAARLALQTAGIKFRGANLAMEVDPTHETTVAWALREAVTNVVKHSAASICCITIEASDGATTLEVIDDGCGPAGGDAGTGLVGLADRVYAQGGTFEAGPSETGGFRLQLRLGATASPLPKSAVAR